MHIRRPVRLVIGLLLASCATVSAQDPDTASDTATLGETLTLLTRVAAGREVGESLRLATAIEVATTPFGTSSGGFAFKLDRSTGLEVRTATTFGPSFAERAITSGAGQMSASVNFIAPQYDRLGKIPLDQMELARQESASPLFNQSGRVSLVLASETTVIQAVMGATDDLDLGVAVPIVRVRMDGLSWVQNSNLQPRGPRNEVAPDVIVRATGTGTSTGLGDIALTAKYRLLRFGGPPPPDAPLEPDPGGLAVLTTLRIPTGSRANLRGLGVYRPMATLIFSAGQGRIRPHVNVGYEWWSAGVDVVSDFDPTVTARHSFQYAVGVELEATPKLTFLIDFLSRQINGGGKVGFATITEGLPAGISSFTYPIALPEGVLKQSLAPGLKWNLKGNILLALNGLLTLRDNGLYARFTPVVGLDWTF